MKSLSLALLVFLGMSYVLPSAALATVNCADEASILAACRSTYDEADRDYRFETAYCQQRVSGRDARAACLDEAFRVLGRASSTWANCRRAPLDHCPSS